MRLIADCEKIKMIISDFDGIFTDGTGIVDFQGNVSKRINFHDVLAIALAIKSGIKVVIITGEAAGAVKYLDKKFPDLTVYQDIKNKLPLVKQVIADANLTFDEVLYIGDDINDKPSLEYVGTKVTVPNANFKIKEIPNIQITDKFGGDGVFREVVDAVVYSKSEQLISFGDAK